jgi:hypothetical protein
MVTATPSLIKMKVVNMTSKKILSSSLFMTMTTLLKERYLDSDDTVCRLVMLE